MTNKPKKEILKIKLKYENGDADNHHLDLYDASISFQGFSKAIAITTHAFLNKGEIRTKGNSISGGRIFLETSKQGSFEQLISIVYENPIYSGLAATALWEAIKYTWNRVMNIDYSTTNKKIIERIEPYFDDLEVALETPLFEAHRPIRTDETIRINISSPRKEGSINLNRQSLQSVEIQKSNKIIDNIQGNVTRYNNITHVGKFFDESLDHTISFNAESLSQSEKEILSWSLHESNGDPKNGKIALSALPTYCAKNKLKRYTFIHVEKII
ncbi:hypothetical protein QSV37_00775 [Acinetobacter sp. VNK23]|uniref:DUF7946 domain-containing protein n=1 Tax=Acinetobacter thutiue TaxID=2998078 RepID=UPI002578E4D9|nr:hypothetical protein [Acinetobacter thutiue]MDM1018852.1 hypothetical protein [Acinetobacter thutiue]